MTMLCKAVTSRSQTVCHLKAMMQASIPRASAGWKFPPKTCLFDCAGNVLMFAEGAHLRVLPAIPLETLFEMPILGMLKERS